MIITLKSFKIFVDRVSVSGGGITLQTVKRREIKYLLNMIEFKKKKQKLSEILTSDPHNTENGYVVRSLYFDTLDDRDFLEKEAGVELRRKIRLRIYDPNASFAMLEMKQKEGEYQQKRSLKITREDGISLSKGDYSCLLKYNEPFAKEMYAYMKINTYLPKVIVEYRRDAFLTKENNIRITFDHHLVATEASFDIFNPNLQMSPIIDPEMVVLEVKYNGFLLSYIKELIADSACTSTSVSKYYMSRNVSHRVIL